jgi:signal transduction histidine kinase
MLLSGMVLGAYALAITTLDGLFENMTGLAQRFTSGIVVLTLMLALNPSRERVQRFVDRIYDRQRWEYRDAVRQASRSFTAILDLPDLLGTALKMIDETVQPVTAEVYTVDEQGNASRRALLRHEPGESGTRAIELLDERAPEVRQVAESLTLRELVTASTPFTIDGEEAPSTLSPYGAMMATGMHFEGRIVGMLMVGPKRSGRWNTSEDGELMRTVADQLAVALQNAEAYETIDNLNRSLETQNVDLERANTELQAAQALLVQAERLAAVGEMSAAVAHAIRNPLAGIKMAAEFGEMEFADHEAAGNFRDILAECDRLNQRITQLLNYSRPFQPDPTRVGLRSVVEGAIGAVRGKAAEKGVRLELQATEDYEVMVDPPLFEQALLELVANAVDASPERERVEVTLGSNGNGTATVEVRDRGAGIPEGKQADLFRLFFTTKKKGTGFGLATVKKIVERHGGQVVAGNAADGGARFVVSVPRAA